MAVMQGLFPALTHLSLSTSWPGWNESLVASVPEEFLNGSAQRLQILRLDGIAFPRKWNLLLTAHHLVELHLHNILHPDGVSPEMVAYLSVMPNLRRLAIGFLSALSRPHLPYPQNRAPPQLICVFLPVLTSFSFYGVSEYAEDLLSRIGISLVSSVASL